MRRVAKGRRKQEGLAVILLITILVMGFAWYTVGALNNASFTVAQREARTGLALKNAKDALLAYVALNAANSTELNPGRLPCPENPSQVGGTLEGQAAPFSSPSVINCTSVGRLPWKTLGIDQIHDGHGEPLWYAVSTGIWALTGVGAPSLTINPGTANALSFDGTANAVVALIIAPGAAVNTTSLSGPPPSGCSAVNQQVNRYAVPYNVANFLECGNSSGSYTTIGTDPWSNDRAISITASEVMDAIAAAVADRYQRQVAPALNEWRASTSSAQWGSSFLPYASTFTAPASNDLCGDFRVLEGQPPVNSSPTCDTRWSGGSVSQLLGILASPSCNQMVGDIYRCTFVNLGLLFLTARIRATAPNVAMSFRNSMASSAITSNVASTISNYSLLLSSSTGQATVQFDIAFPLLLIGQTVRVDIPNLPSAALLTDARMTWFLQNNWAAYTHYAIASGAKLGATSPCVNPGDTGCLIVNSLPSSNGSPDDKRLVLTLMGRAVGTESQPSNNPTDYLESHTSGSSTFTLGATSSTFNDRLAMCPFSVTPSSAVPQTICD